MNLKKWMFWALTSVLWGVLVHAGPVSPLDLRGAANRALTDNIANDQQGGWIDEGSNDLHVLEAGRTQIGNVSFEILSDAATAGKSCIVVGSKKLTCLTNETNLELPVPTRGNCLYLLHACTRNEAQNAIAGRLTAEFADGSQREWRMRIGRDVQPWTSANNAANAQRCWSEYNHSTQVSLFVSKFPLDGKELKALRFVGEDAVWMIVAASLGDDVNVIPLRRDFVMKNDFTAPPAFTPDELSTVPADGVPKNIVLIIGDGMGFGSLRLASLHAHGAPDKLAMESLPAVGMCTTSSGNAMVTDSAASGTALSSGYKTDNGALGVTMDKEGRRTIAEEAKASGRAVGLMTTDSMTGATPSAFAAHVPSRSQAVEIADWYRKCGFDLLIGSTNAKPFLPETEGGIRQDNRNLLKELTVAGYAGITDAATLTTAPASVPVFGFVGWPSEKTLGEMTALVLPRLAAQSPHGFFIMIECSWPDGGGHGNNPDTSVKGVLGTDYAVRAAVDYALQAKDTLVVVTADHETGLLHAVANRGNPRRPYLLYQITSHSMSPVPVFAFGPGSEQFNGVMDNTDIPKKFADFWKLELNKPLVP